MFRALLLGIAAVYFAAAKLGLAMAFVAPQVTVVWPPTGIALAAVFLFGFRVWPAIWLGALLANATTNEPLWVAAGIATGNTLEAVAGAWLARRWRIQPSLDRIRHVFTLLGAGLAGAAISATIGVASLCLGALVPWSGFPWTWLVWWLGDAMSVLVVAPLLLVWSEAPHRGWSRLRIAEGLAFFTGLVAALLLIFITRAVPHATPLHYVMFPFAIVAALRFGQPGTTVVNAVASAIAVAGTLGGAGPFSGEVAQGLVHTQLYLAVIAGTGLILAAANAERALGDRFRAADYAATHALADSATLAEGASGVLRAVCESLDWDFGSVWLVSRDAQELRCLETWHGRGCEFPEFEAATRSRAFARGVGLPGRVWASREAAWISDVVVDANFPRAPLAAREGLHGAFAFPIRAGREVLGVIEFFSRELQQPDDGLLARMAALGSQIGQFVERQRAEEAREQLLERERAARSEAELANRAKDEFLAMLSHELRNPLGAIANASHLLDRLGGDDGTAAAARAIIARQAAHLARLVDDLLDVARVQAGRIELQRENVDLGALVARSVEALSPEGAGDREIRVETKPVFVDGDPARLDQIATNLLANAHKYTRPGGHILVSVAREGDRAVLRVRDDGIGIAPELLPRVFDLFVQGDPSLDRSQGGLGLGLTLVKRLVELHGGTVSAHSAGRDRGSEFTVALPLAPAAAERGVRPDAAGARARRVLVIEDHADSREGLRLLLSTRGHTVRVAEDGVKGLDALRSWRPDVAIVDIGLPLLDGYALARAVRAAPELDGVALVALSGYGRSEDRDRAREAGFSAHLTKPVTLDALCRVLEGPPGE